MDAVGLRWRDLDPSQPLSPDAGRALPLPPPPRPKAGPARGGPLGRVVAKHRYTDALGTTLYEVWRFSPKTFRIMRPPERPGGKYRPGLGNAPRVLYRLDQLLGHERRGELVWVAEGERDVEALEGLGLLATCNPNGAGRWRPEFSECLRGRDAVICCDSDEPGQRHGQMVSRYLQGIARSVKVIWSWPHNAKDVREWLDKGHNAADLMELANAQARRASK